MPYRNSARDVPIQSVNQGQQMQSPSRSRKLLKNPFSKATKPSTELVDYGAPENNPSIPPPRQRGHLGLSTRTFRSPDHVKQDLRPAEFIPDDPAPIEKPKQNALEEVRSLVVGSPNERDNQESKDGVGEVRDTPAQDAMLTEIRHLQRDVEILRQEKDTAKANFETLKANFEMLNTNYEELTGDLEKKTTELRHARTISENEKVKWQRRAETEESLQREILDLKTQLQDQKTHFQSAKRERDRLRPFEASFHELESNIKITIQELDQRNAQLSEVQQLYNEINNKHAVASDELNRMKNESRSMLDDSAFTTKWYDLQADIKRWADIYFWVEQRNKWTFQLPQEHPNIDVDLLRLSDDCSGGLLCLEGGSSRAIVAEAYIWRFIEEEILDGKPSSYSKGFIWAHSLRSEFCRMEEFLRPDIKRTDADERMFQKWKAGTAKLLLARLRPPTDRVRVPVHPEVLKNLVDRVLQVLRVWLTGDRGQCRYDLERIFQSAIDLDSHINEQFSVIYASSKPFGHSLRHGFPFENTLMETTSKDIQMVDGELVGIVVSPALIRSGTANGDEYNKTWILAKSRVLPQAFSSSNQKPKNSRMRIGMITESVHRR